MADAARFNAEVSGIASVRTLLHKAVASGLTASESVFLKGELAGLNARIARVNSALGFQAVEMSPYSRLAKETTASAAMAV